MRVDAAGGDDLAFPGDDFGPRSDDDLDPGLDVGIPRLADRGDPAAAQRDVGLVDAAVIEDQRIGYHRVGGALRARQLALAHAVADHLAPAELDLLAQDGRVALDLEIGRAHV